MTAVNDHTPIIVGVGEITHRSKEAEDGLEPVELMARAMRAAETDAGTSLLASLDSLDVVCQYSWPTTDAPRLLGERLGHVPARRVYGETGGESPVRFIHEAALRIARGESRVAAITGAEARYTVDAATRRGIGLAWTPKDDGIKLVRSTDLCHPVAISHGAAMPITIYPFYENAALAHWGQTPRQAQQESAALWSRYSGKWLRPIPMPGCVTASRPMKWPSPVPPID